MRVQEEECELRRVGESESQAAAESRGEASAKAKKAA